MKALSFSYQQVYASFGLSSSFFRAGAAPSIFAALAGVTFEAALTFEAGVLVFVEGIEVVGVDKKKDDGGKKEGRRKIQAKMK